MTLQRNVYGIALPLRTMMEKNLVAEVSPPRLPGSKPFLFPPRSIIQALTHSRAERKQTQDNHFPALTASELPLGGSMNVHAEILAGTDESIDVGDFMSGGTSSHHFPPPLRMVLGPGGDWVVVRVRAKLIVMVRGFAGALPKETVDIHSAMERRKGMTK